MLVQNVLESNGYTPKIVMSVMSETMVPLQYINNLFGQNFNFYSNLNSPKNPLSYFSSFYKDILKFWSKYYSNQHSLPSSTIISQYLWFNNSFIKIDNKFVVFHRNFSKKS